MLDELNIISDINSHAAGNPRAFADACEKRYNSAIGGLADIIPHHGENVVVMLAGPSSSGKTTTAGKLMSRLSENGISAYKISLDDFYLEEKSAPVSSDGSPDFESVFALDLSLIRKTVDDILSSGQSDLPLFDFKTRTRGINPRRLSLNDGDVVIFEGLHALNPVITDMFPPKRLFKLYVTVSTRIYDDTGSVVLSRRDIRLIRRAVRDSKHRNSSVENTFEIWSSVINGEVKYLFPFEDRADFKLNSFFPYEPCVIRDEAADILGTLSPDSVHFKKCLSLVENLKKFVPLSPSFMPDDSLLREFFCS